MEGVRIRRTTNIHVVIYKKQMYYKQLSLGRKEGTTRLPYHADDGGPEVENSFQARRQHDVLDGECGGGHYARHVAAARGGEEGTSEGEEGVSCEASRRAGMSWDIGREHT